MKSTANILHDDQELQLHGQDEDETLSLRDLPLTATTTTTSSLPLSSSTVDLHHHTTKNHCRPSSDSFFEFLTGVDAAESAAVDVIFNGHILPYASPPPPQLLRPRRSLSLSSATTRSESNSDSVASTRSDLIRPSRSLNCRRLRQNDTKNDESSSSSLLYSRSSSSNSSNSHRRCRNNNSDDITKLPWYSWLIFGLPVKMPAEIELKDLKLRQYRRNVRPSRFFAGDRSSSSSPASWRVLSVLSCKSNSSVDVTNTPPIFP